MQVCCDAQALAHNNCYQAIVWKAVSANWAKACLPLLNQYRIWTFTKYRSMIETLDWKRNPVINLSSGGWLTMMCCSTISMNLLWLCYNHTALSDVRFRVSKSSILRVALRRRLNNIFGSRQPGHKVLSTYASFVIILLQESIAAVNNSLLTLSGTCYQVNWPIKSIWLMASY
jgi:hypothetical protein